jgi:hypothetical protein
LVEWNVGTLLHLLQEIVARREALIDSSRGRPKVVPEEHVCSDEVALSNQNKLPLDEVKEIIHLPEFNMPAAKRQRRPEEIEIPNHVIDQLRRLVHKIASLYHDNPFHNCECHRSLKDFCIELSSTGVPCFSILLFSVGIQLSTRRMSPCR